MEKIDILFWKCETKDCHTEGTQPDYEGKDVICPFCGKMATIEKRKTIKYQ